MVLPPRILDATVCLALAAVSFWLHGDALSLHWAFDDPYLLECAIFESPLALFVDPEVYRRLSMTNYTPLLAASYAADYAAFGLWPTAFYGHQLLALGGVAAGIYLLVARAGRLGAILAALFFLASGPATVAARVLMIRHYVEGACFALLAVLLLRGAERLGPRAWLAGAAYAAAGLCKEVYLPLIVVLPFVGRWPWRQALRVTVPALVAAIAYVALRLVMLPSISGYRDVAAQELAESGRWWQGLSSVAAMICGRAEGLPAWCLAALGLWLAVVVVVGVRAGAWRGLGLATACAALGLATVLPLWFQLEPSFFHGYRLVIHLAVLAAVGLGWSLARVAQHHRGLLAAHGLVALSLVTFTLAGTRPLAQRHADAHRLRTAETAFVWREPDGRVLVSRDKVDYWSSIRRLRRELLDEGTPSVCNAFFDLRGVPTRYFLWDDEQWVDWTDTFVAGREQLLARRDDTIPLSVDIDVVGSRMRFVLDGGVASGRYFFLRGGEPEIYQSYETPTQGEVGAYITHEPHWVRVMKVTGDGRFALSPQWVVDLRQDDRIRWRGGG